MSYAGQLLDTYPRTFNLDAGVLAATIDALNDCAQACTADADDDLSEHNVAELFLHCEQREVAADLTAADEPDFAFRHGSLVPHMFRMIASPNSLHFTSFTSL